MEVECKLILDFKDNIQAENIYKAVTIDNNGFIESHVEDNKIIANIKSKSITSIIHTLDDYLACVSVAEKISGKNNE